MTATGRCGIFETQSDSKKIPEVEIVPDFSFYKHPSPKKRNATV